MTNIKQILKALFVEKRLHGLIRFIHQLYIENECRKYEPEDFAIFGKNAIVDDGAKLTHTDKMIINEGAVIHTGTVINAAGGFFVQSGREYLIRGLGRIENINQLKKTVVTMRNGIPLLLGEITDVKIAAATKMGMASVNNKHGVILMISKQPDANTKELTERLEIVLEDLQKTLPASIIMYNDIFGPGQFRGFNLNNCDYLQIIGNNIFSNDDGLALMGSAEYNLIASNYVYHNSRDGITIGGITHSNFL